MNALPLRGALFLLACLTVVSFQRHAWAVGGTPVWFQSRVGAPTAGNHASSPAIAFDHYGTPSVVWTDLSITNGTNRLYRSTTSGLGFWSHHQIASGNGVGLLADISFDRAEKPTVAWISGDNTVRTQFNDILQQTIVNNDVNIDRPVLSITHDITGTLRGVWGGLTNGNLLSLTGSNGAHTISTIGTLPNVTLLRESQLTVDHTGRRHVISRVRLNTTDEAVLISSEPIASGPWTTMALTTADSVNGVSIATNPITGKVGLAYTTANDADNTSKLYFAESTGTQLITTEVLTSSTAAFEDLDLAYDLSDGRPAIAYERRVTSPAAQEIHFAYLSAGNIWENSLIDATALLNHPTNMPRRPSLAFDDFGTSWPAVAYIDADGGVNVAFDPPVPEPASAAFLLTGLSGLLLRRRRRA